MNIIWRLRHLKVRISFWKVISAPKVSAVTAVPTYVKWFALKEGGKFYLIGEIGVRNGRPL
jgi:hypothetical protein